MLASSNIAPVSIQPMSMLAPIPSSLSASGDKVKDDVLNVVPPQRAAAIAVQTELANADKRWCEVDLLTFESTQAKYVHVLGDAIKTSPLMRKSGHMANQHAKVCAAAVVDLLQARAPSQQALWSNACCSFINENEVIRSASVLTYSAARKRHQLVPGSEGISAGPSQQECIHAHDWASNIWSDMLS
nr:FCSD flavin-binding domain-containing protein [Pseudoduganella violaceinigra]